MRQQFVFLAKALCIAVVVYMGGMGASLVLFANVKLAPNIPWSVPVAAMYLAGYWMYLRGWGPPGSTRKTRCTLLRAGGLSARGWTWSLLACSFGVIAVFLYYRALLPDLLSTTESAGALHLSMRVFISLAVTSAVISGLAEEAAFRGYMLSILQGRYRPLAANVVVALVFGLFHLSHGLAHTLPRMPYYVAIGFIYGAVTQRAHSILPAVIVHVLGDTAELVVRLRQMVQSANHTTGAVHSSMTLIVAASAFSILAVGCYSRLTKARLGQRG